MRQILMPLIFFAAIAAVLLPTLAGTAPVPSSLGANEVGTWLGQIYQYWVEVFNFLQQETP